MSESDPQYAKDLLRYLLECPEKFNFRSSPAAATDLRRALFRAASVNGKYIGMFFPELATDSQDIIDGDGDGEISDGMSRVGDEEVEILQDAMYTGGPNRKKRKGPDRNWIMSDSAGDPANVDPAHPGRPCVRKFRKGEPTYRCLTCGLDDTCVLCQYCYNPEDHIDHQVTVQISQKDCGGVCDCGDPEAWTKQFSCKYHSLDNYENNPIPDELYHATKRTVEIAIDYLIDVFCNSHTGVQKFETADEVRENEMESQLSSEVYGAEDSATNGKYVLSLWNDQKHSFTDALNVIVGATHRGVEFGRMVTKKIDSNGRAIVIVSDNLPMLMEKKKKMEKTGLVNTVRSSKDHFREEMCGTICYWLDDLSKSSLKSNYFVLRVIMSEVLCNPWNFGTYRLRQGFINGSFDTYHSSSESTNSSTIPEDTSLIRLHSSLEGPYIPDISKRTRRTRHVHIHDPDEEDEEDDEDDIFEEDEEVGGRVDEGDEEDGQQLRQRTTGDEFMAYDENVDGLLLRADELIDNVVRGNNESEMDIIEDTTRVGAAPSKAWENTGPPPPPPYGTGNSNERKVSARVQYLIFFDIRLWKDLRLTLRDLYISVLVSNPECKGHLGHFYAQLYPQIAELYMLADREPECSIISSLSTQLFTTPSIATELLHYDYFTRLVAALYTFFTTGEVGPPTAVDPEGYISLDSKVLKNRRFGQLFHDIEYLLNRNTDKDSVSGNVDRISQVAEFMLLFQGMSPIRRQRDKHVEFEPELWIYFFNAVPYVLQLASVVASSIWSCKDKSRAYNCVSKVAGIVSSWALGDYSERFRSTEIGAGAHPATFMPETVKFADKIVCVDIINFKVENLWVSLHHPLHSYLSWLIEYAGFDDTYTLRQVLISGMRDNLNPRIANMEDENLLQLIFEHPIRVLSLLSQIHVGAWVRNGYSVRSQLHHYREFTLRDSAFVRDVFLTQTGLVVLRPNTIMIQLLSKFSLLDWRFNRVFDNSQRIYLVEEFLHHLIFFLMERTQLIGLSEKEVKRKYIVKEIIQCLCFRDVAFSDICKTVPDTLSSDEMFETILRDIAIYKPPSGVRDYGLYQLKPEYYKDFDTHYIHFSSAKIEEAETIIKNKIHKLTGEPLESIVHEPPLEPITSGPYAGLAGFAKTVPFGKFVEELLSYIIAHRSENVNEGVLGQLLHLFHIIALDDLVPKPEMAFPTSFSSLAALFCTVSQQDDGDKQNITILSLLCQLLELSEFSDYTAKIRRILTLLRQRDSRLVDPLLSSLPGGETFFTRDSTPQKSDADSGAAERKKKLGQARKAQILAEFQNQQKEFAQKNVTDDMDLDDDADMKDGNTAFGYNEDDGNEWVFPESQCILCRMPDDNKPGSNNVFGLMGYVMRSNIVRNVPLDDPDWVYEAFGNDKDLDEDTSVDDIDHAGNEKWQKYRQDLRENSNIGPGFPSSSTVHATIMTGCGHGIHFQCYQDYLKSTRNRGQQLTRNNPEDTSRGEYLCPLCRALNNTFLPILWKSNKRQAGEFLKVSDLGSVENFSSLIKNPLSDQVLTLEQYNNKIYEDGYVNLIPSYAQLMGVGPEPRIADIQLDRAISESVQRIYEVRLDRGLYPEGDYIDDLNGLADCFAETISGLEVSLRGKGYTNPMGGIIMDQIPAQSLQMIRVFGELCKTYITYAATLSKSRHDEDYVKSRHPVVTRDRSYRLRSPLDINIVCFGDFVSAALLTSPAYGVEVGPILRSYCTATISHILISIIKEVARKAAWVWDDKIFDIPTGKGNIDVTDEEGAKTFESLKTIIRTIRSHIETTPDKALELLWSRPEFIHVVHSILRKCLAPFLRKCAIFVFALCGDYDPYDFMGLGKDFAEIDKLCEYLGLQSIGSMLRAITSPGELEETVFQRYANRGFNMFAPELEFPSVIRLLRLPERLDDFFNLRNKSLAGKVSTGLVPDPAVCLFCGTSVGMQIPAFDRDRTTGQCQEHVKQCSKEVGIFLLPKRSSMLLLKGHQGSFSEGPYLDLHGEADETMR